MNTVHNQPADGVYSAQETAKPINFYCAAPYAGQVHLVGDFSQWRPLLMERREDGWWFLQVWVPHGHHQYRFLVDGAPMLDLHATGITRDDHDEPVSLIAVS